MTDAQTAMSVSLTIIRLKQLSLFITAGVSGTSCHELRVPRSIPVLVREINATAPPDDCSLINIAKSSGLQFVISTFHVYNLCSDRLSMVDQYVRVTTTLDAVSAEATNRK
jgi:hypothetical protein